MSDDGRITMILGFELGGQACGISIWDVQEVLQMVELTPVPDAPTYVAGAINLRGSVLPVIDMATLIGLPGEPPTLDTPIIVVHRDDVHLGLIVHSVQDVVELRAGDVDTPTEIYPMRRLLAGVARTDQGLVMLYELERVLELASGGIRMVEAERAR